MVDFMYSVYIKNVEKKKLYYCLLQITKEKQNNKWQKQNKNNKREMLLDFADIENTQSLIKHICYKLWCSECEFSTWNLWSDIGILSFRGCNQRHN